MAISRICLLSFLFPLFCFSQTLTGIVIDKVTQEPIETVSVYFDNTTVGTTTNEKGEFSISYTDAIQTTLVISYLGYEKVLIPDFRKNNNLLVELIEANNELDEILLEYDDGLTRKQKLRLFRKEFLGNSKFGKSCKILNEDDLILHYDKQDKTLYASAKQPLKIENKALQYEINFDIKDFKVQFRYVDAEADEFVLDGVLFTGTSFYKNLKNSDKRKTKKNRERVYKGGIQHFMRALYNENLREEGYWVFYKGFRVEEWDYFNIEVVEESNFKKVTLKNKVSIVFNNDLKTQSDLELNIEEFFVDAFGHFLPVIGVQFSGYMGNQRVGDTLPLDYGLN